MRLQTAAFEAINELVRQATNDTLPLVVQLVPVFIQRLSSTLQMQAAATDASERQSEVQVRNWTWTYMIMPSKVSLRYIPELH